MYVRATACVRACVCMCDCMFELGDLGIVNYREVLNTRCEPAKNCTTPTRAVLHDLIFLLSTPSNGDFNYVHCA